MDCNLLLKSIQSSSLLVSAILTVTSASEFLSQQRLDSLADQRKATISTPDYVAELHNTQIQTNVFTPQWFLREYSEETLQRFLTLPAEYRLRIILHSGFGRSEFGLHRLLWIRVTLACAYTLLASIGILSNLLVVYILVVMHRRALTSITNIFVLVLAISDIFLCGFNIPVQIYYELKETVSMDDLYCKVVFTLFGLPTHVSCLIMLLIACDRYQIILHPLLPRMSLQMALCLIGCTLGLGVVNSIPLAVYGTVSHSISPSHLASHQQLADQAESVGILLGVEEVQTYCVEDWPSADARLLYSIIVFCVHFAIPLVVTTLLYGRIYMRLHERQIHRQSLERKRRTNKILIRIVICFAMFWSPWICFSLWLEVHAYDIQRQSLDWIHLNKTVTDNNATFISDEGKAKCYQGQGKLEGKDSQTPFMEHPVILKMRNMDVTIKLTDLLLKLIAMSSSCINPWLYGWLNKFFWSVYRKRYCQRGLKRLKSKRVQLIERQNKLVTKNRADDAIINNVYKNESASPLTADDTCNSNGLDLVQTCHCCGANFIFHFFISPHLFSSSKSSRWQKSDNLVNQNNNSHLQSQQGNKNNDKPTPASGKRSNNRGSRNSQSLSDRQKISRISSEHGGGTVGAITGPIPVIVQLDRIVDDDDYTNAFHREDNRDFYSRFGRRFSPRFSSSSMGTSSYPSTKLTTLMSSSGYTATPRSSFLRPEDQAHGEFDKETASLFQLSSEFQATNPIDFPRKLSLLVNDTTCQDEAPTDDHTVVILHCPSLPFPPRKSMSGVTDLEVLREKDSESDGNNIEGITCGQIIAAPKSTRQECTYPTAQGFESHCELVKRPSPILIKRTHNQDVGDAMASFHVHLEEEDAADIPFADADSLKQTCDSSPSVNLIIPDIIVESIGYNRTSITDLTIVGNGIIDIESQCDNHNEISNQYNPPISDFENLQLAVNQTVSPASSPIRRKSIRRRSLTTKKYRAPSTRRTQRRFSGLEFTRQHINQNEPTALANDLCTNLVISSDVSKNEDSLLEIDEFAKLSHFAAMEALHKKHGRSRFYSACSTVIANRASVSHLMTKQYE